jgi:hypothetical protein
VLRPGRVAVALVRGESLRGIGTAHRSVAKFDQTDQTATVAIAAAGRLLKASGWRMDWTGLTSPGPLLRPHWRWSNHSSVAPLPSHRRRLPDQFDGIR